jgi:hypothetical protein
MSFNLRAPLVAAFLAAVSLFSANAFAGSATLSLVRSTLSNDTDADNGGLWQYEGGSIQNAAGSAVGTYILQRRVTTSGTSAYNTAGETITLFFTPATSGGLPPVITIEGAYSYNSGLMGGSVAAASTKYHWTIGYDANASVSGTAATKLVITWVGTETLHIP